MRSTALAIVVLVAACNVELAPDRQSAAAVVSSDLVIAEVYPGGGNASATYNTDYVVLFNRGSAAATLSGLTLFYAGAANTFSSTHALSGTASIMPGQSYLVALASGATGASLPTANETDGAINLGVSSGKLMLAPTATDLSTCGTAGNCDPTLWIDLVGWGAANQAEGTKITAPANNATALVRAGGGCVDTGDNAADLTRLPPSPRNSSSATINCNLDLGLDATPGEDLTSAPVDLAGYSLLLNEVKWNPAGADNGQEFIELLGSGPIPTNTYVVSVDGDGANAGRINFVHDLSGLTPGGNGLLLLKGMGTTIDGVDAATTVVDDTALAGTPLQNGTETVLVIHGAGPLAIIAGTTSYTSLTGVVILDSIAAADTTGTTFGGAQIAPCPSTGATPVDGASRIAGDLRAQTAAAWYAGQTVGAPSDQYLDKVAACSSGPATWSMSPGRPNDMPLMAPPDLAPGPIMDLAVAHDLGGHDLGAHDLSAASDLGDEEDASAGGVDLGGGHAADGGCAIAGRASGGALPLGLLLVAIFSIVRRRGLTGC